MLLVFKYPASISGSSFDMNLIYFSDFLKFIVNPALVPWIIALALVILDPPYDRTYLLGRKNDFLVQGKRRNFQPGGFCSLDNADSDPCCHPVQ